MQDEALHIRYRLQQKHTCMEREEHLGVIRKTENTFFNFGGSGGAAFAYGPTGATIEGNTGAFSRVDVNVTGPSGASSDRVTGFSADTNIFIRGTSADGPSGAPYINELGVTI